MDTLTISQTLQAVGFESKQANTIAKIINEKNQESATKQDVKDMRWLMGAGFVAMGTALGYIVSLLNTVIGILPGISA